MKKENILVIVLVCIAMIGVVIYQQDRFNFSSSGSDTAGETNAQVSESGIGWVAYDQGLGIAKQQNKPIFLYFYADWCTYCEKLKQTTFKDAAVLRYLEENFVSIRVDTDADSAMATEWNVRGLPTSWFLTSDSGKINSVPGYLDEKQFLNTLKYIHTKSYDTMSFHDFLKQL